MDPTRRDHTPSGRAATDDGSVTEVTLVKTWTGPAVGPSDHEKLREGWNAWLDMLESGPA